MLPCDNPLWPCAMTGAAACLSGFEDIGVIIHGSSGCYFYPASLLPNPIYGTHLIESDVIFGSDERIGEVIREVRKRYTTVAIVTTCVPSVVGEDLKAIPEGYADVVIDAPGFLGNFEEGYRSALETLRCCTDSDRSGVNIDGLNPIDPFYRGNRREAERLLSLVRVEPATRFCADRLDSVYHAAPNTLSTNPDLSFSVGEPAGNILGLEETRKAFSALHNRIPELDLDPLMRELEDTEERIVRACDKFLRRHNPPSTLVFGGVSYALFAATALHRYIDAEIIAIGSRNDGVGRYSYPLSRMSSLQEIADLISREQPDLVLGSSYEQTVCGQAAFVPFTFPLRGRVSLHTRTLAGPEGVLSLMEEVLNACMDRYSKGTSGGLKG
jgi:nitrogenase molybdenum-iron protein alpha/beta subunit